MKLSFATLALLASSVVAAPALMAAHAEATPVPRLGRPFRERSLAERAAEVDVVERSPKIAPDVVPAPAATTTLYADNWAGARMTPPSGTFTAASATFVLPTPTHAAANPSATQTALIWVGIDDNAILQAGVRLQVTNTGVISMAAWYEWFPAPLTYVPTSSLSFSPGDTVIVSVQSTSSTTGTALIQNVSTGKSFSTSLSGSRALTGTYAEWIVEDATSGGSLEPLLNWNSVTFTDAYAHTSTGLGTCAWENAVAYNIVQNGTVLSSVSGTQGTVVVKYIGS